MITRLPRRRCLTAFALLACCLGGCETAPTVDGPAATPTPQPLPTVRLGAEPTIRVRIVHSTGTVSIDAPSGSVIVRPGPDVRSTVQPRVMPAPLSVSRRDGRFVLVTPRGGATAWSMPSLAISPAHPAAGDTLEVGSQAYPQRIVLIGSSRRDNRFDIVNHVSMERYLPGVLQAELYASWAPSTFEAAAIAARSYAVWEMNLSRSRGKSFDVESTVASQAYAGAVVSPRAKAAVAATRGQVLSYKGSIVPAFYSSTCGGRSQNAHSAIPSAPDIAPLHASPHDAWCESATYYRWPTVRRSTMELVRRINTWAAQQHHDLARLPSISRIRVTHTTPQGRPTRLELVDHTGRRYTMTAEDLRHAANHAAPGLPAPTGGALVRSSDCRITISGDTVLFSNGRGFGHGAGLCQWGAQHMALAGHDARAILQTYYRGATIEQAY